METKPTTSTLQFIPKSVCVSLANISSHPLVRTHTVGAPSTLPATATTAGTTIQAGTGTSVPGKSMTTILGSQSSPIAALVRPLARGGKAAGRSATGGQARRGRGRGGRDPGAPKRPKTACNLFTVDQWALVGRGVPTNLDAKEVGRRWRALSDTEKEPYHRRAELARLEYKKALEQYQNTRPTSTPASTASQGKPASFLTFCQEEMRVVEEELGTQEAGEVQEELDRRWRLDRARDMVEWVEGEVGGEVEKEVEGLKREVKRDVEEEMAGEMEKEMEVGAEKSGMGGVGGEVAGEESASVKVAPAPPRPAKDAFTIYYGYMAAEMVRVMPSLCREEMVAAVERRWSSMGERERTPYMVREELDKIRYSAEKAGMV